MESASGLLSDNIAGGGLQKETNWWGAFVIGLAGTILVTGIAPIMVNAFGAAAIPQMAVITLSGYLLCLLLAELSAMMPDRTGGSPTYAMVAYADKRPRLAGHINGATCWAYWLGWFPVAPLNMILASFYLKDRFGWGDIGTFTPLSTPIAWTTVIIAVVGIIGIFIPAYMGIRLGAAFATVLGLLAMIPLTFLALGSVFRADIADWSELKGFPQVDGSSFFSDAGGHGWFAIYLAFAFLLTWNVIAMEAAACYIGECKNPERDAKIAMNLSGAYGAFIYIMIPVSMVVIIGRDELAGIGFDPKTVFVTFAGKLFGGTAGSFLNWAIAIMLIVALALSALNAIMGCARGLHRWPSTGSSRGSSPGEQARRAVVRDGVQRVRVDRRRVHGRRRPDLPVLERRLPEPRSCRCCSATTCCGRTGPRSSAGAAAAVLRVRRAGDVRVLPGDLGRRRPALRLAAAGHRLRPRDR